MAFGFLACDFSFGCLLSPCGLLAPRFNLGQALLLLPQGFFAGGCLTGGFSALNFLTDEDLAFGLQPCCFNPRCFSSDGLNSQLILAGGFALGFRNQLGLAELLGDLFFLFKAGLFQGPLLGSRVDWLGCCFGDLGDYDRRSGRGGWQWDVWALGRHQHGLGWWLGSWGGWCCYCCYGRHYGGRDGAG